MNYDEYITFVRKCKEEPIKPLVEADFNELEEILQEKLPQDFKSYYLSKNGVIDSSLYGFSPIKYGFSIEKRMYAQAQQGLTYGKRIPFAWDGYGHTYVLSLENREYGYIFALKHEYELKQKYDFAANSFTEFLQNFVLTNKSLPTYG